MKRWLQLLLSLIGSVLALWLAHLINIFDYITIIPADKSYDVCITVYFTLVETGINVGHSLAIEWWKKQKTKIEAVIYLPKGKPNVDNKPVIHFNEIDMAEFRMKLVVKGKCSNILDKNIILPSIEQADIQIGRRGIGASIDNCGNFIVEIKKLCQNRQNIEVEEDYKIILQRANIEDSSEIVIKPELFAALKSRKIEYISNEARLILEEKSERNN